MQQPSEAQQRALEALVEDLATWDNKLTMSTVAKLRDFGYIERLPGLEPTFRLTDAGREARAAGAAMKAG